MIFIHKMTEHTLSVRVLGEENPIRTPFMNEQISAVASRT